MNIRNQVLTGLVALVTGTAGCPKVGIDTSGLPAEDDGVRPNLVCAEELELPIDERSMDGENRVGVWPVTLEAYCNQPTLLDVRSLDSDDGRPSPFDVFYRGQVDENGFRSGYVWAQKNANADSTNNGTRWHVIMLGATYNGRGLSSDPQNLEVTWTRCSSMGEQGPAGPQGPQGPPGKPTTTQPTTQPAPPKTFKRGDRICEAELGETWENSPDCEIPRDVYEARITAAITTPEGQVLYTLPGSGNYEARLYVEGTLRQPFADRGISLPPVSLRQEYTGAGDCAFISNIGQTTIYEEAGHIISATPFAFTNHGCPQDELISAHFPFANNGYDFIATVDAPPECEPTP